VQHLPRPRQGVADQGINQTFPAALAYPTAKKTCNFWNTHLPIWMSWE